MKTIPAHGGDMTRREQRIRDRAERLWNEAGQPIGQDERFWQQAQIEIAIEDDKEKS